MQQQLRQKEMLHNTRSKKLGAQQHRSSKRGLEKQHRLNTENIYQGI
jgi:hypothetical protein